MNLPSDHEKRQRFITGHAHNISVIAPAGVGKTRAIVERIVAVARQTEATAVESLSRLVVVTYSVKAAQEMQQRARTAIREAKLSPAVQRAFQRTFFGTIHSYCVQLLERFGHYLGLPSPVELLVDEDECWKRFLTRGRPALSVEHGELFHFYAPDRLYALGHKISPGRAGDGPGPLIAPKVSALVNYPVGTIGHAGTRGNMEKARIAVARWSEAWQRGDRFHPLPDFPVSKSKDEKVAEYRELWIKTFEPLQEWLREAALHFGRQVANAYEAFRLEEAVMTYDDQTRLAYRLLQLPEVQRELAEEKLSVLLDEAQDTDPQQFQVLLRVAGLGPGMRQAEEQSFCIVGDFQQAIYTPRSDLSLYRQVHDELVGGERGAETQFDVTFRCDKEIIEFANKIFPEILHGGDGQSAFYRLSAREGAGTGQVVRWTCPDEPTQAAGGLVKAAVREEHEAKFVAERMAALGHAGLGAEDWSQVAILCPRIAWLWQMQEALKEVKIPAQVYSSDEGGERPAKRWLAALVWVAAHPEDAWEVAGVLREIFGVSDHDMAMFTRGDGEANGELLRLDRKVEGTGAVVEALEILREAREGIELRPVDEAVADLVEKTALWERLASIDTPEMASAGEDLEEALALVYARAAEGVTLAELAAELRARLAEKQIGEEEVRDEVQLMTSFKAKGLEWQTVIVPYMFRPIGSKSENYPRVVSWPGGEERIYRDKGDYDANAAGFVSTRERQRLQRVLYVACTRAKQTLIFVDDQTLFAAGKKKGGWSSGELLGFDQGLNRDSWDALPDDLVGSKGAAKKASPKAKKAVSEKVDLAKALARAGKFVRRVTPHALAVHPPAEAEPERKMEKEEGAADTNAGILYGTWWHEFVESCRWEGPPEAWNKQFAEAAKRSPEPERAAREWALFVKSDLAAWMAEPGRVIHREIPFLLLEAEDKCLEGVMDLAVYTPSEQSWRVVDWKTNRGPGEAELAEIYRGQIEAYARALEKLCGVEKAKVCGSLYLTATGKSVEIGLER